MRYLSTFIFLLVCFSVGAQNITNKMQDDVAFKSNREKQTVNKIGVTIEAPKGYLKYNESLPFYCNVSFMINAFTNRDSSILIGISLIARDSADYKDDLAISHRLRPDLKDYDPDDQWILGFKGDVDSTNFRPIFYSGEKLRRYHADKGVEFLKTCKEPFLNKYRIARVIRLNKKYRGIVQINYFVKVDAYNEKELKKDIDAGSDLVRYN